MHALAASGPAATLRAASGGRRGAPRCQGRPFSGSNGQSGAFILDAPPCRAPASGSCKSRRHRSSVVAIVASQCAGGRRPDHASDHRNRAASGFGYPRRIAARQVVGRTPWRRPVSLSVNSYDLPSESAGGAQGPALDGRPSTCGAFHAPRPLESAAQTPNAAPRGRPINARATRPCAGGSSDPRRCALMSVLVTAFTDYCAAATVVSRRRTIFEMLTPLLAGDAPNQLRLLARQNHLQSHVVFLPQRAIWTS